MSEDLEREVQNRTPPKPKTRREVRREENERYLQRLRRCFGPYVEDDPQEHAEALAEFRRKANSPGVRQVRAARIRAAAKVPGGWMPADADRPFGWKKAYLCVDEGGERVKGYRWLPRIQEETGRKRNRASTYSRKADCIQVKYGHLESPSHNYDMGPSGLWVYAHSPPPRPTAVDELSVLVFRDGGICVETGRSRLDDLLVKALAIYLVGGNPYQPDSP